MCVGMVCYHCIVHILNSRKKLSFLCLEISNSDLCSAMLPNYLRTYSSALCQIRALEKALKKQNNGQSIPKFKILVLNACSYNNDLCRGVLTILLGDIFLSFLPHLSLEVGI